ncbi:MAG: OadG family protein [Lachnospiraceae bacterium]|nr:OadG family protein [Lachnospiraceae bacterium]
MKKFLALICMITCVFGLTACGSDDELTALEQSKLTSARIYAVDEIIPDLQMFMNDENAATIEGYNSEEIEYMVAENFGINTDGYAFISAVSSFNSAKDTMGNIIEIGTAVAEIDDDQIIVNVDVKGEKKDADVEIVFSNDMFLTLESASLNPTSTMGELMAKAALNTLIGMGTVFIVLILISGIISLFKFIPRLQELFSGNKNAPGAEGADNAVAHIEAQEAAADEADDLELAAVIAAAVAASEGADSADGFVVRSIRKINRARR